MKKIVGFIAVLMVVMIAATAMAWAVFGDKLLWDKQGSTLTIKVNGSGTGSMPEFTATSEIPWYDYRNDIETVKIEEGVENISDGAFLECAMSSITIPSSVRTIGMGAFYKCANIKSVKIPSSVASIMMQTFYQCTSLESVSIPLNVKEIGNAAFGYCISLKHISLPEFVTSIGSGAFGACTSLEWITIPDSVTSIEASAFYDCTSLKEIDIPSGIKQIRPSTFRNCSSLTDIVIPQGVEVIDDRAFYDCTGLTKIIIPDSVYKIGKEAFAGCTGLKTITIPASVNQIGDDAIPAGVTIIAPPGSNADKWAAEHGNPTTYLTATIKLNKTAETLTLPAGKANTTVQLTATIDPDDFIDKTVNWTSDDIKIATVDATGLVTAVAVGKCTIICASNWDKNINATCEITVVQETAPIAPPDAPADTLTVGQLKYKLSGSKAVVTGPKDKNAKKLTIPSTIKANGKTYKVTEIKASAFKSMKKLTAVTIGANVKTIGKSAFQGCAKLKTVTIKTKKLTAASVKSKAFKGIYKKATFKCPKGKANAYKKILLKKGAPKTSKFK